METAEDPELQGARVIRWRRAGSWTEESLGVVGDAEDVLCKLAADRPFGAQPSDLEQHVGAPDGMATMLTRDGRICGRAGGCGRRWHGLPAGVHRGWPRADQKYECHSGRRGEHGDGCGRERKKRDAVGGAKRAGGVAGPGTSRAGQQYFGHAARPQGSGRYRLGWAPRYRHVARLSWQLRRGPRPPAGARAERSVSLPRGDSPPSGSDHGRVDWAPTADYVIPVETAQIEWRIVQTASGVSRPL